MSPECLLSLPFTFLNEEWKFLTKKILCYRQKGKGDNPTKEKQDTNMIFH